MEKIWKEIKCKGCGTQEKQMFMMQPAHDKDDCYCENCRVGEMKKRAEEFRS